MSRRPIRIAAAVWGILAAAGPLAGQAAPPVRIVWATPVTQPSMFAAGEGAVLKRFMAENPDIEVIARQIPFESYDTQILLSVRGGSAPDLARVNTPTLRMWAGAGYLMPLDDFVSESKVVDPSDYWEGFWQFCRIDGKQYVLPLGTDCRVLYYHLGRFKEAGITTPPRTWAALAEAARKIQITERKIYGIALPASNEWNTTYDAVGNFLVANDGNILNEDCTRGTMGSDPAAAEAFRFICELITSGEATPPGMANITGEVIESLFVQDRLGMTIGGPFVRDNLRRLDASFAWGEDYETALVPVGPGSGHSGSAQGGWLVGVFNASEHKAEALRLLEFMQRPESLATICAVENLPPRRACIDYGPFADPFYEVFFEQLPTARPPLPSVPQAPNVARAVQRAYQQVVSGGSTVDEAIDWLDDKLTHHVLR